MKKTKCALAVGLIFLIVMGGCGDIATSPETALRSSPSGQDQPQHASNPCDESHPDVEQEGRACESYEDPVGVGRMPWQVNEASGLVSSGLATGVFWSHNDSGDSARIFALRSDGQLLATVSLKDVRARDWEDIARGPCGEGSSATSCLYIADIGDNGASRDSVYIYRVEEPDPHQGDAQIRRVETMRARYEDGPRDAEGLVVDGRGHVFIFSKRSGLTELYHAPFSTNGTSELGYVTEWRLSSLPEGSSERVTGADLAPESDRLLLRTYTAAIELSLDPDLPLEENTGASWRRVSAARERQGESIAYTHEGGYLHTSEGHEPTLWMIDCMP